MAEPQFARIFTMADQASLGGQRPGARTSTRCSASTTSGTGTQPRAREAAAKSQRWGLTVLLMECARRDGRRQPGNMSGFGPFGPGTLLGVIAALIAAATAWTQAKQFSNLAAYTIAHQELTSIRGLLARPMEDEAQWSSFVDSAEGAISREHTMWRAARAGGVG